MIRTLAAGLAALTIAFTAIPAFAGAAENAFLQTLVGNYIGKSVIADQNGRPQPITCRLVVAGSTGKVTYTGRCSIIGGTFSMTGAVSFINDKYMAAMSSSSGMSGTVTGVKHASSVSFSSSNHDNSGGGDRNISSTLTLGSGSVRIDFNIKDNKTGKITRGSIPFGRA